MGTQSTTTPILGPARPFKVICECIARYGVAVCLMCVFGSIVQAQTQATMLPLALPSAIAFDAQGNLYFAETGNHTVRKLSAGGVITTVAGSGVQGFWATGGRLRLLNLTRRRGWR